MSCRVALAVGILMAMVAVPIRTQDDQNCSIEVRNETETDMQVGESTVIYMKVIGHYIFEKCNMNSSSDSDTIDSNTELNYTRSLQDINVTVLPQSIQGTLTVVCSVTCGTDVASHGTIIASAIVEITVTGDHQSVTPMPATLTPVPSVGQTPTPTVSETSIPDTPSTTEETTTDDGKTPTLSVAEIIGIVIAVVACLIVGTLSISLSVCTKIWKKLK